MYHCNKSADAPWFEMLYAPWTNVHPDSKFPRHLFRKVSCELAREHSEQGLQHAEWLGELEPGLDGWALWDDEGQFTFVLAPPCGASDDTEEPIKQESCTLFADHPPGHSWEFLDDLHG